VFNRSLEFVLMMHDLSHALVLAAVNMIAVVGIIIIWAVIFGAMV
jgi:hypothetical protein